MKFLNENCNYTNISTDIFLSELNVDYIIKWYIKISVNSNVIILKVGHCLDSIKKLRLIFKIL